ncbi:MAG: hypothetical protein IPL50_09495 [Chitinophagaceae bacterium]|nr:hypothetical protein [Chitinophagaceae bacterium]
MFLLSGREDNPVDGKEMMNLRCFNPDLTLRWKKTGLGTIAAGLGSLSSIMPDAAYGNNVVYFVADSVFNIGTNYFTYNLFFAFDISSGTQLWKRRGTTDKIENPIVKNDTIYCNYLSNGINYVAAPTRLAEPNSGKNLLLKNGVQTALYCMEPCFTT